MNETTTDLSTVTEQELVAAFTAWDRDYREHPDEFMSTVQHLLNETPESYGEAAAPCLLAYIEKGRA